MSAAELTKVYNDNTFPLIEKFKGQNISIPPGKFIEMEWYEAVEFRGQYSEIKKNGSGVQTEESKKIVRLVGKPPHLQDSPEANEMTCQACNGKFANDAELNEHINKWHLDQLEDQDLATKRKATGKKG